MASKPPPQQYTIGGVKVAFPCKAYPTQLSMMSMIIKGIDKKQNCLLESPTGSGKSLALLCSSLAWQHNEYVKREREMAEEDLAQGECEPGDCGDSRPSVVCVCNCSNQAKSTSPPATTSTDNPEVITLEDTPGPSTAVQVKESETVKQTSTDETDEIDFQPPKKRFRTPIPMPKSHFKHRGIMYEDESEHADEHSPNAHTQAHWQMKLNNPSASNTCSCPCHLEKVIKKINQSAKEKDRRDKMPRSIPKIYFGTRTHKQIEQIIRELKKTEYKNSRMSILGSREYTCIHPRISKGPNKNDGCNDLRRGKHGQKCTYYNGTHKIKSQWQLQDRDFKEAWDIEDLCKLGKQIKACPYFATRALKDDADIVFCPYNYLIDPVIRDSMEIFMKDQILVLDEAHNIEDSAREAASYSVTYEQLQETCDELTRLVSAQWRLPHTRVIHALCVAVKDWITTHSDNLRQTDYNRALRVFSGQDVDGMLCRCGVIPATLPNFQHSLGVLIEESNEDEIQNMDLQLSTASGMMLKGLLIVIGFLFKQEKKYMRDYKIALIRTMEKKRRRRHEHNANRWLMAGEEGNEAQLNTTLHFWCLNPAVAFSDFGNDVRSIILTSGTLSPMTSFASELGVNFPIQLEANHVIHKSQVWVGTVALGPHGTSLNASYRNAETFAFQDEIGRLLLHVCQVIPYGVLCFLPSYGMLSKLLDRWRTTGAWDQLSQKKSIVIETRGGDKNEFDEQLKDYYNLIEVCEETDIDSQEITGGLFFAVCRGKVSEGMDFADNNARAVITIGIPFPSFKDTQVELKRAYNDQHSSARGLLTGSEWYEIQAYRALNQALGRCIRHKMDWGALILVDDRFSKNPKKYINGLSKWVRAKVLHHIHSKDAIESLSDFAQARLLKPCPEISNASMNSPPSTPSPGAGPSRLANISGFTPSTTPSVKPESSSGYTPIVHTPARPQDNLNNGTPKLPTEQSKNCFKTVLLNGKFVRVSTSVPNETHGVDPGQQTAGVDPVHRTEDVNPVQQTVTMYELSVQGNVKNESPSKMQDNKATSLNTPAMNAPRDISPQQGFGGDRVDSIATPKAKLNFAESETTVTSKEQTKLAVQQSFAKKLQKFAHKAASDQKKGPSSKFYQFVDLTSDGDEGVASVNNIDSSSKQDGCQAKMVAMAGEISRGQQIEQQRMACNQTPPLFDTEESENTIIPESPERTNEDPETVQDEELKIEDKTRKRKLESEDAEKRKNIKGGDIETQLAETKGAQVVENNNMESGHDKKRGIRKGRLSRRHSEEKKTPVKEACDGKETTSKQDDLDEDVQQGPVRRSARRRHGKDTARQVQMGNDFLDAIGDNSANKGGRNTLSCRPGLFCLHCGEGLSQDLRGVESVLTDDLPSEFLRRQAKQHVTKSSKRSKHVSSCPCQPKKDKLSTSKPASEHDTWLVARKELLKHCEPFAEGTRVLLKGLTMNAHWNDVDQSCYRPVTCGSCPQGFIQLGYEILATNNSKLSSGKVWFPPQSVGVCHQASIPSLTNEKDNTGTAQYN